MLALLAAASVMLSALPGQAKPLLAGLVLLHGLVRARRAASETACTLVWRGGDAPATLERAGRRIVLHDPQLEVRGPMVRFQGRANRRRHQLLWWPDTLDAGSRRRLVLAARTGHPPDINLPSMAA